MDNEDATFTIITDEGKEIQCEIIFTFESEDTHKSYIMYTDNSTDEDGNLMTFAAIYNPDDANTGLFPIETEAEFRMMENIFEKLQSEDFDCNQ